MAKELYIVNLTKKIIASTGLKFCDVDRPRAFIALMCAFVGDSIELTDQDSGFIEGFMSGEKHQEYKYINLNDFDIKENTDLYECKTTEALLGEIDKKENKSLLPIPQKDGDNAKYYSVRVEGFGGVHKAMYRDVNGQKGWWTNFFSKIESNVIAWENPRI